VCVIGNAILTLSAGGVYVVVAARLLVRHLRF